MKVSWTLAHYLKDPFCDPQPHPHIFSKNVEIFTLAEAFRFIMFVCKIFLANSFVLRKKIVQIVYYVDIIITNMAACATVRCSKTCMHNSQTQPRNSTENWEINLFCLYLLNCVIKIANGPLKGSEVTVIYSVTTCTFGKVLKVIGPRPLLQIGTI